MAKARINLSVSHNYRVGCYNISVCKMKRQANHITFFQRIQTLQVIEAADIKEAVAYAEKWFGITREMYRYDPE